MGLGRAFSEIILLLAPAPLPQVALQPHWTSCPGLLSPYMSPGLLLRLQPRQQWFRLNTLAVYLLAAG